MKDLRDRERITGFFFWYVRVCTRTNDSKSRYTSERRKKLHSIHPSVSSTPLVFCLKKRASILRMARKRKSALLLLYFPHSFLLIFFGFCFCLLYLLAYLRRKNMTSRLYNSSQEDYMSVNGCNWSSHKYELKKILCTSIQFKETIYTHTCIHNTRIILILFQFKA